MIEFVSDMLASPLIQRAFIVAVLVGLAAPVVGTYLVQRGLALLGDGIGHIALTGIALGWLAGAAANVSPHDAWAVPGAIIISVLGAVAIEVIRANGRTRGDVALAILFYGGIAGGVILIRVAGGTTTNLNSYLFGSISTVSVSDAWFTIALGWLAGAAANVTPHDAWAVPGAILISVLGAVMIEVIRANGRTRGDVALAILFYGGIAGGVILIRVAGGTTTNLNSYLFGSISTVSVSDAWFTIALATLVLLVGLGLRGPLFALCHDEEFAHACGLPTGALNVLVAVVAALTVSVSMRVVGALLVSAVMIVPVAIAQLVSHSFARTMYLAMGLGVVACVSGLTITYLVAASPGAMIVVLLVGGYAVVALASGLLQLVSRSRRHHITSGGRS